MAKLTDKLLLVALSLGGVVLGIQIELKLVAWTMRSLSQKRNIIDAILCLMVQIRAAELIEK